MREDEWYKNNMLLVELVEKMFKDNVERCNYITDRLLDYSIENITIGDIKQFIIKKLGIEKDIQLSDSDIIKFILDEKNRDELIRFGQLRNPIDTSYNRNPDHDDSWEQML